MNNKEKTVCFSGHRILHEPKEDVEKSQSSHLVSSVTSGDSAACAPCIVIIAAVFVLTNLAADIINNHYVRGW